MRVGFLSLVGLVVLDHGVQSEQVTYLPTTPPPRPDPTTNDVIWDTPEPSTDSPPSPVPTKHGGGFYPITLSNELKDTLYSTLANIDSYDDDVTARICVRKVLSVQQQYDDGFNYAFETKGCDVHDSLVREYNHEPKPSTIVKHVGKCSKGIKDNCVEVQTVVVVDAWDGPDNTDKSTSISSIQPLTLPDTKTSVHVRLRVHKDDEDEDEDDDEEDHEEDHENDD